MTKQTNSIKQAFQLNRRTFRAKERAEKSIFNGTTMRESNEMFDHYRSLASECKMANREFKCDLVYLASKTV